MILYNVTIKIDHKAHSQWLDWMKYKHIPEVMETGCFVEYRFCKMLGIDETDGVTYAAQYLAKDLDAIQDYQENHAPSLQEDYKKNWENLYVVFRSLLEVVHKG